MRVAPSHTISEINHKCSSIDDSFKIVVCEWYINAAYIVTNTGMALPIFGKCMYEKDYTSVTYIAIHIMHVIYTFLKCMYENYHMVIFV